MCITFVLPCIVYMDVGCVFRSPHIPRSINDLCDYSIICMACKMYCQVARRGALKMQDLKMEDQIVGVENAGPENAGPRCRGGKCRTACEYGEPLMLDTMSRQERRFCATCADTVASMDSGCPICRSPIRMVLRLYQ